MAVPYHTHTFEIPAATQADVEAGTRDDVAVTPSVIGTAATKDVSYFATASQGGNADTAVQTVNGKSGTSVTLDKTDIGLGNVDNTADIAKPVSAATQTALDQKANTASLGTAAFTPATNYATAAQGTKADSAVQPAITIAAGTGLAGGGTLAANRTIALSSTSIASLALADTSVQPGRFVSAGTGLAGGGSLAADRTLALSAASIASLAKADTAIQAPGGSAGQVLTKNSGTDGDVSWQSVAAATAVSYAPQTLTAPQKKQARDNIDASPKQTVSITAITSAVAYVDVTLPSNFESFELILNYIIPATSAVALNMQFSTDNGATFYTSTDYRYSAISVTSASAGAFLGASNTTSISIANDISNVHGFSTNVNIYPGSSAGRPSVSATTGLQASFGYKTQVISGALITVFQRITTIRLFCSSGNIASGRVTLEGVRND